MKMTKTLLDDKSVPSITKYLGKNTQNRPGHTLKMLDLKCLSVCEHIMA